MNDGFIKVATATPQIKVGNTEYNSNQIIEWMKKAKKEEVKLLVFPELCITAYTCGELFLQRFLLDGALAGLEKIKDASVLMDMVIMVGLPFSHYGKLYNVAAVIYKGDILGLVPKENLPAYSEFYESRHFTKGSRKVQMVELFGKKVPFGMNLLFQCKEIPEWIMGCELCEDLWVANPPSISHALHGATVICNLSASDETTTKEAYRRNLVSIQSAKLLCAYLYADAGEGESTTDLVYAGHNIICENGSVLAQSKRFQTGLTVTEIDVYRMDSERRRMSTFQSESDKQEEYEVVTFQMKKKETILSRTFSSTPFIPKDKKTREERCDEIIMIQASGLKKRLIHTHCQSAVVGISGGLDSTLAVLVTAKAFDMAGISRDKILCVTMPCFGTTDRTYQNAVTLIKALGATLYEVDIKDAVNQHFKDIGQDPKVHDITYENSQARERTQILMDLANKTGGLVIGTGDMSELALGWATYNGDHMSMYGVNCSVPKTLVRHLVRYYADTAKQEELTKVLLDVLDTPVSPELLPPENGVISQKTEDIVGPYELHDFFLYYLVRFGFGKEKIYRLANLSFQGEYEPEIIEKWLNTFYRRFFSQQFKRSCLPDGPKVGSVSLSPRGDWRLPSDVDFTS